MVREILDVPISLVEIHSTLIKVYESKNLNGLKMTMTFAGQLEPIKVVQRGEMYQVFDGVSRYKVAIELKWETITVEVCDLTDEQLQDQSVLRNYRTKRSFAETCKHAEVILGILGSSQGKRRERIGDLLTGEEDYCLAGKNRFELACEILGYKFSAATLRRLMAVKDFEENGSEEVKSLGLMEKIEKEGMKINTAHELMETYLREKKEQGTNALTEALDFVNGDHHTLYNRDCTDLKELQDESIDLVFFSPPYHLQRIYPEGKIPSDSEETQIGADKNPDEYVRRTVEIYRGVKRVLKSTGSMFINIAESYEGESCLVTYKLVTALCADGWSLQSEWIWKKKNQKPHRNIKRLLPTYEKLFHFVKDKTNFSVREFKTWTKDGTFEFLRGSNDAGMGLKRDVHSYSLKKPYTRMRDFLDAQNVDHVIETTVFNWEELKEIDPSFRHMAPFNSTLPLLPILMTTKPGDTVLDIFSGTGTTVSVAVQLGRNGIGYDTDSESHKFAAKRLTMVEQYIPTQEELRDLEEDYMVAA